MKINIKAIGKASIPIILYVAERLVSDKWNEWQMDAMIDEKLDERGVKKDGNAE